MFTKMVLPILGGAPSVWSVAMVFFQGALLAGYAYAHLLARTLPVGRAALVHLGVLAVAALTLPIGIAPASARRPRRASGSWLVGLFAASIGLPFVALAASAPLLQSWFAASGHRQARQSVRPLCGVEPRLVCGAARLSAGDRVAADLAWAGLGLVRRLRAARTADRDRRDLSRRAGQGASSRTTAAPVAKPLWRERFAWIALAAIPAGLVVAVTAYISTDVAAAPLLWVLPLALYLLTFVAVFRDRPWFSHALVDQDRAVSGGAARDLADRRRSRVLDRLHGAQSAGTVRARARLPWRALCRRPAPALLTEFYLWTSLGGVIGGIFAGLLAPHLFNRTYEYPILIVAALLVMPGALSGPLRSFLWRSLPGAWLAALAILLPFAVDIRLSERAVIPFRIALVALVGSMLVWRRDTTLFAALAVVAFIADRRLAAGPQHHRNDAQLLRRASGGRDLGRHVSHAAITAPPSTAPSACARRTAQPSPADRNRSTYYYFGGPISEGIASARATQGGLKNVAVVGLGAGSLACHRHEGENWTFFEIDPEVVRLARDSGQFRFLSQCAPGAHVVLGDARLTLTASAQQFDLIVLDAFSSDAIPVHLLTREALRGYLARLSPRGMILMHISNRHMELAKVVAAVGAAEGLVAIGKFDRKKDNVTEDFRANAQVAILARNEADLAPLLRAGWEKMQASNVAAWTDDYSDIMGAILRMKFDNFSRSRTRTVSTSPGFAQDASSSSRFSASITESRRTSARPISP